MIGILEYHHRVDGIDFGNWQEAGIELVLFDREGTLTEQGDTQIDPAIAEHLLLAKDLGQIANMGIVSNSTNAGASQLAGAQIEIPRSNVFVPRDRSERKPGPGMVLRAMDELGYTPAQTAMVGDKNTADIAAAKAAGLKRIAWVDRLGNADLIGDRLFRRPYESIAKWQLRTLLGGSIEIDYDKFKPPFRG